MTIDELHEYFIKLLPSDQGEMLDTQQFFKKVKKEGIDQDNPSMFAMASWMAQVNKH